MTEAQIQQLCDGLSVCVSCFKKIQACLMSNRTNLCHVCFQPCPDYDFGDLLWIKDEQFVCCGSDSCKEHMIQEDNISRILEEARLPTSP